MKKFILLSLLTLLSHSLMAQTKPVVSKPNTMLDKDGYYKPVAAVQINTGKFYLDKDNIKYPVYKNNTDKLFIILKSKKTGKEYKRYLKL